MLHTKQNYNKKAMNKNNCEDNKKKATKKTSGKKLKVPDGSNNKAAKPNFIIETTPEFICWTVNQNNGD